MEDETVGNKPASDQMQEAPDLLSDQRRFFLDELAAYQALQDSRYNHLSKRISKIERDSKGFDDEDPTRMIIGMFVMVVLINIAVPLLEGVISKWRLQSSPSLPLP